MRPFRLLLLGLLERRAELDEGGGSGGGGGGGGGGDDVVELDALSELTLVV